MGLATTAQSGRDCLWELCTTQLLSGGREWGLGPVLSDVSAQGAACHPQSAVLHLEAETCRAVRCEEVQTLLFIQCQLCARGFADSSEAHVSVPKTFQSVCWAGPRPEHREVE